MDNYSEYNDPLSVGLPREAFRILAFDSVFPEWALMRGGGRYSKSDVMFWNVQ